MRWVEMSLSIFKQTEILTGSFFFLNLNLIQLRSYKIWDKISTAPFISIIYQSSHLYRQNSIRDAYAYSQWYYVVLYNIKLCCTIQHKIMLKKPLTVILFN